MAAKVGARVLSLEKDLASARLAFHEMLQAGVNYLIVLQDIGNPSPSMGWRESEKLSMSQRIYENVDCILALAILHHLLVSSAIPLEEIIDQLADWTSTYLVIEFIPPQDPMFLKILDYRNVDFSWLTYDFFKACLTDRFEILKEEQIHQSVRKLFYCKKI